MENALKVLEERGFVNQVSDEKLYDLFGEGEVTCYIGFDPSAVSLHVGNLFVMMALAIADHLRPALSSLPFTRQVHELSVPLHLYPIFGLIWVSILMLLSVYDGRRNLYVVNELTNLTIGSILASVSLAGLLYLSYRDISRFLFVFFALQAYGYIVSWRLIVRLAFHLNQKYQHVRNVLIIGAGKVGRELQEQITQHPYMGLEVIGFLDDDLQKTRENHR